MQFLNTEIDPATLPAMEDLNLRPLSPDYLRILRLEWFITTIILILAATCVIFFIDGMDETLPMIAVVATLVFLVAFYGVSQEKAFPIRAYSVREHDIVSRSGWIIRTVKICPLNRVQNCTIHVGPLERKYGLATLSLFTAGSTGADLKIPGLPAEEAEAIRKFVLSRINDESESN